MRIENIPKEVFDLGIMDKEYHARLIADLENVSLVAGIPPNMVWSKLSQYCEDEEFEWVRHFREITECGLAFVGPHTIPVEDKMMAITGAFLRNHIDARMIVVQDIIKYLKDDDMPSPCVLLIPNFCLEKTGGGDIPTWEVSSLLGLLYSRMAHNQKTILYIGSMTALEKQYGAAFKSHIENHYKIV